MPLYPYVLSGATQWFRPVNETHDGLLTWTHGYLETSKVSAHLRMEAMRQARMAKCFAIDDVAEEWESTSVSLDQCKLRAPFPVTWFEWMNTDGTMLGSLVWDICSEDICLAPLYVMEFAGQQPWDRCVVMQFFVKCPDDDLATGFIGLCLLARWYKGVETRFAIGEAEHMRNENGHITGFALGLLNSQSHIVYADRAEGNIVNPRGRVRQVADPYEINTINIKARGMGRVQVRSHGAGVHAHHANARRHLVRGGFRYYGSEYGRKNLFGKYPGCWYWRSFVRGNANRGYVRANYRIETI